MKAQRPINSPNVAPKIVLFLGAGASSFAGYYTFAAFSDLLFDKELRNREGLPPIDRSTEKILKEIETSLKNRRIPTTHDNFLWKLNSYADLSELVAQDPVVKSRLGTTDRLFDFESQTRAALEEITATTIQHYSVNRVPKAKQHEQERHNRMRRVLQFYYSLASLTDPNAQYLPVFTTNYDMLIEDLVSDTGYATSFFTGFPGYTTESASWSPNNYPTELRGLHLYRLHGCVCWFYHGPHDPDVYFHRRDCCSRPREYLCALYPGREIYSGLDPYKTGFRKFYELLITCKLAVFIGFSFRDYDVMHILLRANAQRQKPMKMLIFDSLYQDRDILANLSEASKKSLFPCRIPALNEVQSICGNFAEDDFDEKLLDIINQLIRKG